MKRRKASDYPPAVLNLFDGYVHGSISRREFMDRAAKYAVGGFTAAAMFEILRPDYALAQQVQKSDPRIRAEYLTYATPQGSGTMRGYFARPAAASGKLPAVVVIHENRGLNPYIEDVARRLAAENFVAFAPDALAPAGGYPGDDDKARQMFASLDDKKRMEDLLAAVPFVKSRPANSARPGSASAVASSTRWPCAFPTSPPPCRSTAASRAPPTPCESRRRCSFTTRATTKESTPDGPPGNGR